MTPTQHSPSLTERLGDNLSAHRDCAELLLSTLDAEHGALLANDVGALEQLTRTKSAAAERLAALGGALLRLRAEAAVRSVDALFAHCDPAGTLSQRWQQVIALAARCHGANQNNAALLDARQQQVRGALRLLDAGAGRGGATYGRYGEQAAAGSRPLGLA